MTPVLLYDCDGVLADTEAHGHRVAFNRMWREFGVPWEWSVAACGYTGEEDFSEAALVVSCLGDPGGERCEVLANRSAARPGAYVTVADLQGVMAT